MFKELEQLISKRAERKISFKHHTNNNKKHSKKSKKKNKPKLSSTVVPKVKTINEQQPKKTKKKSFSNTSFTSTTSSSSKNHHHETESEHDHLSHPGLSVKPRGGSPGPRFMTTFKPSTVSSPYFPQYYYSGLYVYLFLKEGLLSINS